MSSRLLRRCSPLIVFGLLTLATHAQQGPMAGMNMAEMKPLPRPDQLPPPIHMTGIGNSHLKITASPEAQAWFDQGLNLTHDFWDYEAARAFQQGIRTDPNCAMCYWGLARTEGARGSEARSYGLLALKQATALKKHVSKSEKLYIEAAESEAASDKDTNPQLTAIYRRLVALDPRDIQARIFLAGSLGDGYDDHGNPKGSTVEKITILESVLRDAPDDSAANHYWIHAMEPSNHPERALGSAAKLARLAPNSGHMVHMPGHIFYRCGDYAQAEHWFAASTTVDEDYMAKQHVAPDDDWNYVHNLMYGIANLMEEGKLSQANTLSERLGKAHGQVSTTLYIWSSRDSMTRINNRLPIALRTADWPTVLTLLKAQEVPERDKTTNLRFLATQLRSYATGMAALDREDLAAAQAASDSLDAELWRTQAAHSSGSTPPSDNKPKVQPDASMPAMMAMMPDALADPIVKGLSIASLELRAGILLQQKKPDAAKKLYTAAAQAEKDLGYHEPPFYIRPVGETEGAALSRSGDYKGAIAAYKAALDERPNSGFGLYGLAHVEQLGGMPADARRDYSAFLKVWSAADPNLPELAQARLALNQTSPSATTASN